MSGSITWSVLAGTFAASAVEVTEMVIIVVGVGAMRGWRSTWVGVAGGFVVLVGIVAGLGTALRLIPIDTVRIIIGALLLTFGLQWYRQGVIGTAADGFTGGGEEEEVEAGDAGGGLLDWTAVVLAFKGVTLEGLEVAFIVVAFGAGGGGAGTSYVSAYIGAAGAFVVIGLLGIVARTRLERVPGRTLKFGVGGLLATFGTFWSLEGLGVHWPGEDLSLLWLYALNLSATFALMFAVRAGLLGPTPESNLPDPGAHDPSGLAPASERSIRAFQQQHGLAVDGVVGQQTQAAVRAVRSERGGDTGAQRLGVDPADARAIAALQRRLDVPVTGRIDAMTRGLVRLLQHPGFVDPLDEDAVRRFQRHSGLEPSGVVDGPTMAVLRAVLADARAGDPLACSRELDPADERSVARFQAAVGLPESGAVDAETRGALRALRAWLVVDPTSPDAVRAVQREHGVAEDGVIGSATREAIAHARREAARGASGDATSEPDPFDEAAVRAFQRRYGLAEDGRIGEQTRAAIRWEREHHLGVDATSAESVRRFQRRHGLPPDGVVGPQTQAAMQAVRRERRPDGDKEREQRYGAALAAAGGRVIDAADGEATRRFQRDHGLAEDGTIGELTKAALRGVRRERGDNDEERG